MNKWNLSQYPSQEGKVAIITGSNSGIGFESALQLAKMNMMVILACKRLDAAEKAKNDILKSHPTAQITPIRLLSGHSEIYFYKVRRKGLFLFYMLHYKKN